MPETLENLGGETVFEGKIFTVHRDRFRHPSGEEVEREVVRHSGAAGVVAHDDECVYLVRQPREALARDDVLEIPAGLLDEEGEAPAETAKRELAEELGLAADHWEHMTTYFSSVGFTDEEVHLFLATGLRDVERPEADDAHRIEVVRWPLDQLGGAIEATVDAKTLIGLLWLERTRRS